jgi:hypothetical protein
MIDQARIKSDFDCEILLGAEFFRMAIHALFDSGQLESSVKISNGATFQFDKPTAAEIIFDASEYTTVGADGRPGKVLGPADMSVTFPTHVFEADGGPKATQLRLCLGIEFKEHQSPVTKLVNKFDLIISYAGMHQESWDWFMQLMEGYQLPDTINPNVIVAMAESKLREKFYFEHKSNFLIQDIQKVAIRKLPAEPGFQPCYAVYVNLPLKLGPTFELIREETPHEPGRPPPFQLRSYCPLNPTTSRWIGAMPSGIPSTGKLHQLRGWTI